MKNKILLLTIVIVTFGCNRQNSISDLKTEKEKWKTELQLNGEVGSSCIGKNGKFTIQDEEKWMKKNPNTSWGMQEFNSIENDFNSDGIKDCLFYFSPISCVGGNVEISDIAMLVYSHKGQFLTNKSITKNIEENLKGELARNGIYNISVIILHYESFNKTIGGKYYAWDSEDAHCCPSSIGTFQYNPVTFSLIIKNKYEKQIAN